MPATYEPINTQALGTAVADVYFNSIPQTYTDLVLVINGTVATATNCSLRFNSDNLSNYSATYIYGDGTSAVSGRVTSRSFLDGGGMSTANSSTNIFHIFNYTNSTTYKTCLVRASDPLTTYAWASIWRKSPAAITAINVLTNTGANFSIGTTFTLYGIKAA